jgi:dihydrofolate reductase
MSGFFLRNPCLELFVITNSVKRQALLCSPCNPNLPRAFYSGKLTLFAITFGDQESFSIGEKRNMRSKSKVIWDVTASLDGFIADTKDSPGRIFDWYFRGDTPSKSSGIPPHTFKLTKEDAELFDNGVKQVGAIVAGRRTYEVSGAWDGSFFIQCPFFVLTHEPPKTVPPGTTKFTFVTKGTQEAIRLAKRAARGKAVSLMGANVAKQCIESGLVDELVVHVAPFLMGDGVRLFDFPGTHWVELKRIRVNASSSGVTHLVYKVVSDKRSS